MPVKFGDQQSVAAPELSAAFAQGDGSTAVRNHGDGEGLGKAVLCDGGRLARHDREYAVFFRVQPKRKTFSQSCGLMEQPCAGVGFAAAFINETVVHPFKTNAEALVLNGYSEEWY